MDPLVREILTFWFGDAGLAGEMERREVWFRATPEFDREIAERFTAVHERAAAGALDRLRNGAADCLGLIIALDQFPRNIYRGAARAFAADARARAASRHALARGYDLRLPRWARTFLYLPFEHSERLADQERAVALYRRLGDERSLAAALAHREAIRRFGRFPHRNAALGRTSTPEEEEYLRDPPFWGKTAAEIEELERRKAARTA